MKHILLSLIVLVFTNCADKPSTESEQITAYYKGYINSDYEQIKKVLSDSLTTVFGDYITTYSHQSYYEQFKWDSIFKPVYKLDALKYEEGQFIATVSIRSLKLEFLKNTPMTCRYQFQFIAGKISRIEELDCNSVDWNVWQNEVDTLVNWIKINHPEMDGFIHDLSMQGAIDYLKAIELYKNREVD
ncbi:hypothetical protein ADIWIN_3173 [Winogradskyella psychrotolerans RS-3]|uniref:Uncharacterized protein n=1 Tax=Winogradskyella psychrotolerans RS-3 TaxID=641526 RepID=S7VP75_9FLAO|nr:hypothetical protein [Winogradskyella psychrotolerans]EPR71726.1 hypothetical protein ADIWIN_3173 [Winogradskyella psychrotolerans RS-3]